MAKKKKKLFYKSVSSPKIIGKAESIRSQRKLETALSVFVIVISVFLVLINQSPFMYKQTSTSMVKSASVERVIVPENVTGAPAPILTAKSYIVIEPFKKVPLASNNSEMRLLPASTTKLMTALVTLEQYNLDDIVPIGPWVGSGQKPELTQGEKISVENLLYAMLVNSDNDAAIALANFDPLGQGHFLGLMNQKSVALGLTNTHFINPAGFDDPNQYSTAYDLAQLGAHAMAQPVLSRIVGTKASEVYSADQSQEHPLTNLNKLLGEMPGVRGIKTGYTEEAGENLVTDVVRSGHELIFVVLGSTDRFGETKLLVDWAFTNFEWREKELSPTVVIEQSN